MTQEDTAKNWKPDQYTLKSIENELSKSLAESLYMKQDTIDIHKKFITMGLDSIVGVEWVKKINRCYDISIKVTKIYDYPTIHEFAKFLIKEVRKNKDKLPEKFESPNSSQRANNKIQHQAISFSKPKATSIPSSNQSPIEKNEVLIKGKQKLTQLPKNYGLVLSEVSSIHELSLSEWIIPEPDEGEVTIQVKVSAINFPDTMCVKGLYPTMPDYPFVPGFEV